MRYVVSIRNPMTSKLSDVLLVGEGLELDFCRHGVYVGVPWEYLGGIDVDLRTR